MKRIILAVFCCFVAFAAGRLSAPVGTLTLASGAKLTGPLVIADACITTEDDAKDIFIDNVRMDRGACRFDRWGYLRAAFGQWSWLDKWRYS